MQLLAICAFIAFCFLGCFLDNPVEETPEPTEIEYCHWLLEELYFWDMPKNSKSFTDPESLFNAVDDPYTRYVVPVKAPESEESTNTSFSPGEIGIELGAIMGQDYPLIAYRIYPESPAAKANIPRYAVLMELNGVSLKGDLNGSTYQKTLAECDSAILTYATAQDTITVKLSKEKIILPTVFLDTLNEKISWITLKEFRTETLDRTFGTVGELKTILKNLSPKTETLVFDLRNNPGGSLKQCSDAADLFVKEGVLFSVQENVLFSTGKAKKKERIYKSNPDIFGEELNLFLYTNARTASCAEVFAMALKTGNSKAKSFGTKSFGKGIAQTIWKTPKGGIAYITNMQIFDRFGETYHKEGILPDFSCDENVLDCIDKVLKAESIQANKINLSTIKLKDSKQLFYGEAFEEGVIFP